MFPHPKSTLAPRVPRPDEDDEDQDADVDDSTWEKFDRQTGE